MRAKIISLMSVLIAVLCTNTQARIVYVDDDGPADFSNIQAAIDDANDGDTIIVKPGTYTGDGNRDIDFKGKAIIVKSQNGPNTSIIDCQASKDEYHRGFYFNNNEDANSILQGFTIKNGYTSGGGGINCYRCSPKIMDCIITKNTAYEGGGISVSSFSNSTVINCIISDNYAYISGGGVYSSGYNMSNTIFKNCIISGNNAGDYGGGIYTNGNSTFSNCTIWGNISGRGGGGVTTSGGDSLIVNFSNCIIWKNINRNNRGNQIYWKSGGLSGVVYINARYCSIQNGPDDIYISVPECMTGNWISEEPNFANPGHWETNDTPYRYNDDYWLEGDYHLKSQAGRYDPNTQTWIQDVVTSPCIDIGDPNSPIELEPFPNGGYINMGAYGGTNEASKSYFGKPVCETIVAGDINGDCRVDILDMEIMLLHWLEEH
ncbi:MAG: hypothetical protein JXA96_12545 [Sedimentisphaerales bacterium]|nr:hypothetical protein [Sedimentisphaerales bacterium]